MLRGQFLKVLGLQHYQQQLLQWQDQEITLKKDDTAEGAEKKTNEEKMTIWKGYCEAIFWITQPKKKKRIWITTT